MPQVNYRLGPISRIALYTIAVITDIIQMILLFVAVGAIINTIVSLVYYLTFGTILFFNNINIFGPKQARKTAVSWFGEAVPFLNVLPWFLIGTFLTIRQADKEDREKANPPISKPTPTNITPFKSKVMDTDIIKKAAIILLCLLPFGALAQTKIITTPDLTIRITPQDPGPNTPTTINLSSYSFDINRANIDWIINGIKSIDQTGPSLNLTTGQVGELTTVKAQINPQGEAPKTVNINLNPAQVDLIWRGDTYTPLGYLGGRRITPEATGQVTALPNLIDQTKKPLPSEQLVYLWTDNGKEMALASGIGKDTYTFKAPIGGTKEIKVTVESLDGRLKAHNTALIPISKPSLIFYEDKALLGTNYYQALKAGFNLQSDQTIIKVVPYFFPNNLVVNDSLIYRWSLNGRVLEAQGPELGVEDSSQPGVAKLEVVVNNPNSLFQNIKSELNINVGNTNQSTDF